MAKDFNNNPAFDLLTGLTEAENKTESRAENKTEKQTENKVEIVKAKKEKSQPIKIEIQKKEARDKKILLLLPQTLFNNIRKEAKNHGVSTNDFLNQVLEAVIK